MYNVNVKKNMALDFEQATNLVAQVLKDDFEFLAKEINTLKAKKNLSPVDAIDLANDISVLNGMREVLKYYLVHDEYVEFMELQRVYGNV